MTAQLWLDTYYPKDKKIEIQDHINHSFYNKGVREHTVHLTIPWGGGRLDLTDFINLQTISLKKTELDSVDLSKNKQLLNLIIDDETLSTLDLSNNTRLKKITIKAPKMNIDLNTFSHLSKSLESLNISGSNFSGSIECLKYFKKLEYLNINGNQKIKGELQNLPEQITKEFYYEKTTFEPILEKFNHDIKIWRTDYKNKQQ